MIECVPESLAETHGGPDALLVSEDPAAVRTVPPQALVGLSRAQLQEGCPGVGCSDPSALLCTRMDLGNAAVKCRSRDSIQQVPLGCGSCLPRFPVHAHCVCGDEATGTRVTGDGG